VGVVSAFSGNIFVLGKVFSDFELLKTEIQTIKSDQNVLELQQEILENSYKIKSLRLQVDDFGEGS
jgi:DNA repair protein RadC